VVKFLVFDEGIGSVSIVTGLLGFDSWQGQGYFLFSTTFRPVLRTTQLPIQWWPGAHPLRIKRPV